MLTVGVATGPFARLGRGPGPGAPPAGRPPGGPGRPAGLRPGPGRTMKRGLRSACWAASCWCWPRRCWPSLALAVRLDSPGPAWFRQDAPGPWRPPLLHLQVQDHAPRQHPPGRRPGDQPRRQPHHPGRAGPAQPAPGRAAAAAQRAAGRDEPGGPQAPAARDSCRTTPTRTGAGWRSLPGMTGWQQVNGAARHSWRERVALDVWYVDHRSLRLDLRILWRTVGVVLRADTVVRPGRLPEQRPARRLLPAPEPRIRRRGGAVNALIKLVLAPHPDDEVLGAGGAMARWAREGHTVHVAVVTRGPAAALRGGRGGAAAAPRPGPPTAAWAWPAPGSWTCPRRNWTACRTGSSTARLAELLRACAPDELYLPFLGDVHLDHQLVFQLGHGGRPAGPGRSPGASTPTRPSPRPTGTPPT